MSLDQDQGAAARKRPLPPVLRLFVLVASLLTALSWSLAILLWDQGRAEVGGMWAHWDDRFADIEHYDRIFRYLHQARFFQGTERFAYPAPSAVVYDLLLQLQGFHLEYMRLGVVITLCLALLIVPSIYVARAMTRRGIRARDAAWFTVAVLLTSWPLVFLIERANLECTVIVLTFAGAVSFWRGKPVMAAVFWALAGSMKIYPVVMLLLFVNRKEIKALGAGLLTFAGSLLLSSWFVGPTLMDVARGTIRGMSGFVSSYADRVRFDELKFDHSYLALLKAPIAVPAKPPGLDVTALTHTYLAVVVPLAILVYLFRVRSLPRTNQYVLLSLAMVSLPPVSYDYTLFHLYPSFAVLVLLAVQLQATKKRCRALWPLIVCFTLLLCSENFLFYGNMFYNGPIKAVAMLIAMLVLLWFPLPDLMGERSRSVTAT